MRQMTLLISNFYRTSSRCDFHLHHYPLHIFSEMAVILVQSMALSLSLPPSLSLYCVGILDTQQHPHANDSLSQHKGSYLKCAFNHKMTQCWAKFIIHLTTSLFIHSKYISTYYLPSCTYICIHSLNFLNFFRGMDHHILMQKERKLSPETFFTQLLQTFFRKTGEKHKGRWKVQPQENTIFSVLKTCQTTHAYLKTVDSCDGRYLVFDFLAEFKSE